MTACVTFFNFTNPVTTGIRGRLCECVTCVTFFIYPLYMRRARPISVSLFFIYRDFRGKSHTFTQYPTTPVTTGIRGV